MAQVLQEALRTAGHVMIGEGVIDWAKFEQRAYQLTLARNCLEKNTLLVLPTAMGKTFIASLAIAQTWRDAPKMHLFLAPTKPLAIQHGERLQSYFLSEGGPDIRVLTGSTSPSERAKLYGTPGIVVATPQVIQNDLVSDAIPLDNLGYIVFDEAHRASGEYAYVQIAKMLPPKTKTLAMTASPGSDPKKVKQLLDILRLNHIEIRAETDPDVSPYVQEMDLNWEQLPVPGNVEKASKRLELALQRRVRNLRENHHLAETGHRPSKTQLLELGQKLQQMTRGGREADKGVYAAMTLQAQCLKLIHMVELVETQGTESLRQFFEQMERESSEPKSSKATRALVADDDVLFAYHVAKFDDQENPKLGRLEVLLRESFEKNSGARAIVFANYRATCEHLARKLSEIEGFRPTVFVGQSSRKGTSGMTQKEQIEAIEKFKLGEFNVLIATSVAEEGLDIPSTDIVVFYEPVGSEIRSIQRRGRTGRNEAGSVYILMAKGTQDEIAYYSGKRKEEEMIRQMHILRQSLGVRAPERPRTLQEFSHTRPAPVQTQNPEPSALRVIADNREAPSGLLAKIKDLGAHIQSSNLEVGDFIVSDRIVIERKTPSDFVASILDGRLFEQLRAMQAYPRPILILEGDLRLHGRQVKQEAIWGAISSASLDFGVGIIQTRDADETAEAIVAMAKREQRTGQRSVAVRAAPEPKEASPSDALSQIPGISSQLANRLLAKFGSIQGIASATREQLQDLEGIGHRTATYLHEYLRRQA